ncbi:MAG: aldehyde ferredoxin oxidoreductase N-terminal domain-containing protein [Dehalococcoidia bacterium]
MFSNIYGWAGKILKVDLSNFRITEMDTMQYADRFLGGRGIATWIYWEEVGPEVGAFAPENLLILMSGPLGATGVQGASRFEVVGKSPMLIPEGFCYGNLGGYFGPYLKKAGYDGIVVAGCAKRPSYILVNDGKVEILDASSLWGKGICQVKEILRETHGKNVHFVTTGVAGENKCRAATLMTDHDGSATGGFGAVMGSKKLKAIAVVGTEKVAVARPEELTELNRLTINLSNQEDLGIFLPDQLRFVRKAPCYQCSLSCGRNVIRTSSGKEGVRKCQSSAFYLPWVEKSPGEPIETVFDATQIANNFSLCTVELARIIRWLEDCNKSGYLTEKETGLNLSKIGSLEFIEQLVNMISYREGFGDIIAEGLPRAVQRLGEKAQSHVTGIISRVGGVNGSHYNITYLLNALEPRNPVAMIGELAGMLGGWFMHRLSPGLSPVSSEVFRSATAKYWGNEEAWDLTSYEGKATATVRIQNRTYVQDSLILCSNAWPFMYSFSTPDCVGDSSLESRLFSAVTGIKTDEAGLDLYGERIFNLQRGILLREGWQAKASDIPEDFVFTDPIERNIGNAPALLDLDETTFFFNPQMTVPGSREEPVSIVNKSLDRKGFEEMRKEFYELRGWDAETGLQRSEILERLGLSDMVQELAPRGLVK